MNADYGRDNNYYMGDDIKLQVRFVKYAAENFQFINLSRYSIVADQIFMNKYT